MTILLQPMVVADAEAPSEQATPQVRFEAFDVFIDSGEVPLAAYQFELVDLTGSATLVGIEGGKHPAFSTPPYYDAAALIRSRVIIAAFSMHDELPSGKTCVATVHMQISGNPDPEMNVEVQVAALSGGERITATADLAKRTR